MRLAQRLVMCLTTIVLGSRPMSAATLITFDDLAPATQLSDEYASVGVLLSSTGPLGPQLSADPADWLHPGEAVAPYVFTIVAVPPASTPSTLNKVIGAKIRCGRRADPM